MRNINEPLKNEPLRTDTDVTTPKDTAAQRARTEGDVVAFRRDKISESHSESALLPESETQKLHSRWDSVQSTFVDEPRRAVEEADELVSNAIQRLSQALSDERSRLKADLKEGDEVSTEDLRIAVQRYRALFLRLISI